MVVIGSLIDCLQPKNVEEKGRIELVKAELDDMDQNMRNLTKDEDGIVSAVEAIIHQMVEQLLNALNESKMKANQTETAKRFEMKISAITQGLLNVLNPPSDVKPPNVENPVKSIPLTKVESQPSKFSAVEIDFYDAKMVTMEKEMSEMKNQNQSLLRENRHLKDVNEAITDELQSQSDQIEQLESKLKSSDHFIASLEGEIRKLQQGKLTSDRNERELLSKNARMLQEMERMVAVYQEAMTEKAELTRNWKNF